MRPSWPEIIEEERHPMYGLPRGCREAVQRQADEPPHTKPRVPLVRRDRQIGPSFAGA